MGAIRVSIHLYWRCLICIRRNSRGLLDLTLLHERKSNLATGLYDFLRWDKGGDTGTLGDTDLGLGGMWQSYSC